MAEVTVKVHAVAEDGLPQMDDLVGRVAFIWDGAICSGWPIGHITGVADEWEASEDRMNGGRIAGVTHWVEFPVPVWELVR